MSTKLFHSTIFFIVSILMASQYFTLYNPIIICPDYCNTVIAFDTVNFLN